MKRANDLIPVVFATNEKYAPYVDVCVKSIYANCSPFYRYEITVLHTDLKDKTIERLEKSNYNNLNVKCLDISDQIALLKDKLYSHSYFSKEMYYRILIPRIFRDYDKVIYLDCDMVVLGDLAELYNIDIGDNYIAACRNLMHGKIRKYVETKLHLNPDKYINSGLIVFNVSQCKQENFEDKFWENIAKFGVLDYPDQDLFNIVCAGKIHYLDLSWNWLCHLERLQTTNNELLHLSDEDWQTYQSFKSSIKIVHFTGDQKPWQYNALPMSEYFWRYARGSEFESEIVNVNAKINKPKIILEFIVFIENNIEITACLVLPRGARDSNKIIVNGNLLSPNYSYTSLTTYNKNYCTKKYFRFVLTPKQLKKKNLISFTFDNNAKLAEYGKFFPLNGIPTSYFAQNGWLLYRDDRYLVVEKSCANKIRKHERDYIKSLRRDKAKAAKRSILKRYLYKFLKPFVRSKIVLINDRPQTAGDNGEAMFKYLNAVRPKKVKPYFVIDKSSKDFARLKKIGKVVATGSKKLKILNMLASARLSSQTDYSVYTIMDNHYIKDIMYNVRNVFLQHGITKDDVSGVYSRYFHNFRLFITASRPEYESIVTNKAYGCPERITKLTGFARHDLLENKQEKIILVAPTWRKDLLENIVTGELVKDFDNSDFYKHYKALLSDVELKEYLASHGYKIWFVIHNMLRNALPLFEDCFDDIVINASAMRYSEIFAKGALMITDYSSNAFEFAYLRKPLIYYQFDSNSFFEGHTYNKGYFDYNDDGFGEVVCDANSLKNQIVSYVENECQTKELYLQRMNEFFAYNDKNNCKRIWEEITKWL